MIALGFAEKEKKAFPLIFFPTFFITIMKYDAAHHKLDVTLTRAVSLRFVTCGRSKCCNIVISSPSL